MLPNFQHLSVVIVPILTVQLHFAVTRVIIAQLIHTHCLAFSDDALSDCAHDLE